MSVNVSRAVVLFKTSRGRGAEGTYIALVQGTIVGATILDLQLLFYMQKAIATTRMVIPIMAPGEVKSQWQEVRGFLSVAMFSKFIGVETLHRSWCGVPGCQL